MRILLTLGFGVILTVPSQGGIIFSTLGTATAELSADDGFEVGAGFTMPAGASYDLTSATVGLGTVGIRSISGVNINIQLFGSDSGGNPVGPALVTFTHPADFGGVSITEMDLTVTPLASFVLQPSTTYWLVLGDSVDNGALAFAFSAAVPTGIASSAGTRQQQNVDPPQTVFPGTAVYQIDATQVTSAVPEPSTVGLSALGLFALLYLKRRFA
jgi:PEP-CTERM motif